MTTQGSIRMDISSSARPRLKQGVIFLSRSQSSYVGRMDQGIEIFDPTRSALNLMTGVLTCSEISEESQTSLQEIMGLIHAVDEAGMLDTESGKISAHSRFHSNNVNRRSHSSDDSNDAAHQQMQMKILPELTFSTWQEGVRDGGVALIAKRRNVEIEIFGYSRIAILLYGILLASGFSETHMTFKVPRVVAENDLSAGYLRPSDVGLPIREQLSEAAKGLSLFPNSRTSTNPPATSDRQKFAVAFGQVPAEQIQEWISNGTPHLFVDVPNGPSLTIGPIVIPSKTPCLRCIAIIKEENSAEWKDIAWQKMNSPVEEVPVAVAHFVSGLIALHLLKFFDEGVSDLIGASQRIDYREPHQSERRTFARHPACGCNW